MLWRNLSGPGLYLPSLPPPELKLTDWSFSCLNWSLHAYQPKLAFIGRVWTPNRHPKIIDRVQFAFGDLWKTDGTGLIVSIQDLSLAGGPPSHPDGIKDQYRVIPNSDPGFLAGAWYRSGLLTSDGADTGTKRTVTPGDQIAIVIEADAGGYKGEDTINLLGVKAAGYQFNGLTITSIADDGGVWSYSIDAPVNVVLEFSDGTFGGFMGAFPASAAGLTPCFTSASDPDEYALHFRVPVPFKVDGLWAVLKIGPDPCAVDLVLYKETNELAVVGLDASRIANIFVYWLITPPLPRSIPLRPGHNYYLAVRPQGSSEVRVPYFDLPSAAHFQVHSGGPAFNFSSRTNLGPWNAPVTTRRPLLGLSLSALRK